MAILRVEPAEPGHIAPLAAGMRAADRAEIWASHRHTPDAGLAASLAASALAWAGLADDEPFCLFGVAPAGSLLGGLGVPWLLGTDALPRHATGFLRFCPHYVAAMLAPFGRLANFVDARNRLSIRWLAWLGFTLHPAIPFGPDGLPFHPFEMRAA